MNKNTQTGLLQDRKALFSTLWIFVTLNYLYCDLIALMDPESLKQFLAGDVGGIHVTQQFLLSAAVLMEIPMAMVLLSKVLKYRANRWANVIAGAIMTLVQCGSLFFGTSPTSYYMYFSVVEIACTAFIVWFAWKWSNPETNPEHVKLAQAEMGGN
jgi:hypothetical protein